jgi:hypothetical protein
LLQLAWEWTALETSALSTNPSPIIGINIMLAIFSNLRGRRQKVPEMFQ